MTEQKPGDKKCNFTIKIRSFTFCSSSASMEKLQKTLNDKSLKISSQQEKGRCLFITRDFSPGKYMNAKYQYQRYQYRGKRYFILRSISKRSRKVFLRFSIVLKVLISYITRQKALKEQYFFTCTCSCCLEKGQIHDIRESAILEGYICEDRRCTGFLLRDSDHKRFICQQCGLLRDKEEIKNISGELKLMSKKASALLSSANNAEASIVFKTIEKFQMKIYHPFSINLMRTRETLLKILMELQDWKEALSYCRLTIPIYERAYPRIHPSLGLQYYTCGKLEWFLGETEAAVQSLTKAWDVLRITHGMKTLFMMELLDKLEEARAEASYNLNSQIDD